MGDTIRSVKLTHVYRGRGNLGEIAFNFSVALFVVDLNLRVRAVEIIS